MEKSKLISVLPVNFDWYDVGNVEIFLSRQEQFDHYSSNVVSIEAHNNLVALELTIV